MRPKNAAILMLTAFIWGTAFVAQSVGMDYLGPFTFNGVRSLIGAVALLPCIWLLQTINKKEGTVKEEGSRKDLIIGGIACGLLLFAASSLQQIGIQYTSAGKAGFITAFYIVIVPVLGMFLHKKIGWKVWIAVLLALAGLYFLCITERFTIGRGDIFIFLCALVFSLHIMVIDYFSPKVDGVKMSCIQFFVCGIVSIPFMVWTETPGLKAMLAGWIPLLYAGVLSCGVAYTLQIVGQKNVNPAIASLILSLESCFSVLAGWMILGERLSVRESAGCVLMFAAIILAQLPDKKTEE
ncbi:DMT family transporter [Faecalicatena contorta]|uniref:DMT family transporter n=1 Tax=Faecalicatena contorta TaxID=39482 RepID=UPI001F326498|nr:DMT family transporter [Faecalicatena contorta]MCF2684018.1 DMT family transporter [Faecalicatena contorta]